MNLFLLVLLGFLRVIEVNRTLYYCSLLSLITPFCLAFTLNFTYMSRRRPQGFEMYFRILKVEVCS